MKLLPTGRKSSLAIFAYSSVVSIHLCIENVFFSEFNVTLLDHRFMVISEKTGWRDDILSALFVGTAAFNAGGNWNCRRHA
jgi:hypothetical protein